MHTNLLGMTVLMWAIPMVNALAWMIATEYCSEVLIYQSLVRVVDEWLAHSPT